MRTKNVRKKSRGVARQIALEVVFDYRRNGEVQVLAKDHGGREGAAVLLSDYEHVSDAIEAATAAYFGREV